MVKHDNIVSKQIRSTIRKTNIFKGTCKNKHSIFNYEIYGVSYNPYYESYRLNVRITEGYYTHPIFWLEGERIRYRVGSKSIVSINTIVRKSIKNEWSSFFCGTFGISSYVLDIGTIKHITKWGMKQNLY